MATTCRPSVSDPPPAIPFLCGTPLAAGISAGIQTPPLAARYSHSGPEDLASFSLVRADDRVEFRSNALSCSEVWLTADDGPKLVRLFHFSGTGLEYAGISGIQITPMVPPHQLLFLRRPTDYVRIDEIARARFMDQPATHYRCGHMTVIWLESLGIPALISDRRHGSLTRLSRLGAPGRGGLSNLLEFRMLRSDVLENAAALPRVA